MTRRASGRGVRAIRLTYLITDLEVGGVPLHLHRLARSLPRGRIRPRVISLADEGPVGRMLREAGVPVHACGARGPRDVRALWRLWRLLRDHPPDVLHSLLFHANAAARIVGPLAGVPASRIICEIQTAEQERRWHLALDNLTCRLCRCEVGNSPSVVAHLRTHAHIPASRLRCQWGAVEVDRIASATPVDRSSLGLLPAEPVVMWVGRLDPVKGFEEMLAAFARAAADVPARFVLVGDGPYRPVVERLVRDHGLSERVIVLGRRSDVPGLLRAADVFLFCSRTEGLPNALLEAMAAGLPVVATDVPGCRDVIVHGETGVLAPAGDVGQIHGALVRLLRDAVQRKQLGERAGAWVRRHYDVSRLAESWMRVYEGIVTTPPGG